MSAMYQTFQNTPIFQTAWRGFLGSKWTDEVNVRDFIQNNYTQYDGDESFLAAPTSATHLLWERLQKLQKEEQERIRLLTEYKDQETVTKSGRRVRLCANVGSVSDVAGALQNGAEGIGLFRSEYLFLEADHCPTEEEQFQTYRLAAEMMQTGCHPDD